MTSILGDFDDVKPLVSNLARKSLKTINSAFNKTWNLSSISADKLSRSKRGKLFESTLAFAIINYIKRCTENNKIYINDYIFDGCVVALEQNILYSSGVPVDVFVFKTGTAPYSEIEAIKVDIGIWFYCENKITHVYAFQCKYTNNSLNACKVCPFSSAINLMMKRNPLIKYHSYIVTRNGITPDAFYLSQDIIGTISLDQRVIPYKKFDIRSETCNIFHQIIRKLGVIRKIAFTDIMINNRIHMLLSIFIELNITRFFPYEKNIIDINLPKREYNEIIELIYNILPIDDSDEKCIGSKYFYEFLKLLYSSNKHSFNKINHMLEQKCIELFKIIDTNVYSRY